MLAADLSWRLACWRLMRSLKAWICPEAAVGMLRLTGPPVPTLYSLTTLPFSQRLTPEREMDIETVALVFMALSKSAQRPPQPVRISLSGTEVCHWTC